MSKENKIVKVKNPICKDHPPPTEVNGLLITRILRSVAHNSYKHLAVFSTTRDFYFCRLNSIGIGFRICLKKI
jgi:hypothetical protein